MTQTVSDQQANNEPPMPVIDAASREQTSTQAQGITIRPRLPDFEFDESLPRLHSGNIGLSAFFNFVGVFANVGEKMFIKSARKMLPLIEKDLYREELSNFITQEAYHSSVHERMNKVQKAKGYPIDEYRKYMQTGIDDVIAIGGEHIFLGTAVAGEQVIGVFGDQLLENPAVMDGCDPTLKQMMFWHAYEEVEHSAALFDSYKLIMPSEALAYRFRMLGSAYLLVFLACSWLTGFYSFMEFEGKGEGRKRRNWQDIYGFFFGKQGVFQDSGRIIKSYFRKDFHPWQDRDACKILNDRAGYVKDEWFVAPTQEISSKDSGDELRKAIENSPNLGVEMLRLGRFTFRMVRRSFAFRKQAAQCNYWRERNIYLVAH